MTSARAPARDARATLRCELDLPYGDSPRERIDLFPAARADAPVFCFIHGGYGRSRDKSEFSFIARRFVDAHPALAAGEVFGKVILAA